MRTERWLVHKARVLRAGLALKKRKEVPRWVNRLDQPAWTLWWVRNTPVELVVGPSNYASPVVEVNEELLGF